MGFLFSLGVLIAYWIFFHEKLMDKLGFSQRDESLLMIGLYSSVCINNIFSFISSLLLGAFVVESLIVFAIFAYFIKSRYDSL